MSSLLQDLRFAARMLWRNRVLTAVALLGLATGIGANTTIFSGLNAVALRPLPFSKPGELVALRSLHRQQGPSPSSYLDFADWRRDSRTFSGMAAIHGRRVTMMAGESPERLEAAWVSKDFFPVLGRKAIAGRWFSPEDHEPGAARVCALSEGLWSRRFGADAAIVGRAIRVDGALCTIVGIAPADMRLPPRTDLWLPLDTEDPNFAERGSRFLTVIGRLQDEAMLDRARAEMGAIARRLELQYPDSNRGLGVDLVPLQADLAGGAPRRLLILQLAVLFLLLIACANVANLLLAGISARRAEIGIRAVLGAGRARLMRQLLTESLLLFLLGGLAGLVLAHWGLGLIRTMIPAEAATGEPVVLDSRVLLFTLGLSVLTGLLVGLVAAWRSARGSLQGLIAEARREPRIAGALGLRRLLVGFQVTLTLALLTAAGLMLRSLWSLQRVDPGFGTARLLSLDVTARSFRYHFLSERRILWDQIRQRAARTPGVSSAALTTALPLGGHSDMVRFFVEGRSLPDSDEGYRTLTSSVSTDYFRTMGIPMLRGRPFTAADRAGGEPVVIVSQTLARNLWPGGDPVGARLRFGTLDGDGCTIVGVAGDVRHTGLDQEPGFQIYHPIDQTAPQEATLVVRTTLPPERLNETLRRAVWAVDPSLPIESSRTMEQLIEGYLGRGRAMIRLLTAFALATLVLAGVGIFGLVSFSVAQRTHEIGLRIALGASEGHVLAVVARQGIAPVLVGLLLGFPLAFGLTRLLAAILYGVQPLDPFAFTGAALLLGLAGLSGVIVPAWRALRIDPAVAIRAQG